MTCKVKSISLNKINKYFDGQWQGMRVASDGSCYFGSSTHSPKHGSSFFRFNPSNEELEILAEDMTEICGEDLSKTSPQGKIHSPIVEADGWIYYTTHLSNYWEEAMLKYPGAHVIGYEISTGKFRDFGIVKAGYTIYSAINVDRINKKLYVFSVPFAQKDMEKDGSHLYQIDIKTGEKADLGKVPKTGRGACFWFYVDDSGKCWFTVWKKFNPALWTDDNDLYCYEPDSGTIKSYRNVLPVGKLSPDGRLADENLKKERSWTWAEGINNNKQCLFTMGWLGGGDERLWLFDPSKDIKKGEAFQPLGYIGATFLSVACNSNRVFYIQYKNLDDARKYCSEFIREFKKENINFEDELHLRSISLNPEDKQKIIDHGIIIDQDNRNVTMIESMAADDNGNIFFNGSWDSLSVEESSHQYIWQGLKDDYAEMCDTFKGEKINTHKLMNRGQFFSYTNEQDDLK
ncbi:MAG TPA: hypothetical protein GXZ93_02650 [Actinobacteria bacterium]|nr:hypothetical protein [Actinomycetota bacterium]